MKQLFFLLSFPFFSFSQITETDYFPLRSYGKIPADFHNYNVIKTQAQLDVLAKEIDESPQDKKIKRDFIIKTNYALHQLLLSGQILFNDTVGKYINKVADKLLAGNKVLRSKVHFYLANSSSVNAFSTDQGVIYVSVALISRLKTEGQLAWILSHEISHCQEKHVIENYLEKVTQAPKKGKVYEADIIEFSNYSRQRELEADSLGFKLFLKAGYDPDDAIGALNTLLHGYLSYERGVFEKSFLEAPYMKFPEELWLKETKAIDDNDEYDDKKSTHPNVNKRKMRIQAQMKSYKAPEKGGLSISNTEFFSMREICRFQEVKLLIKSRSYLPALYCAYGLMKNHPGNKFLEMSVAKSLYGISMYKTANTYNYITSDHKWKEGNGQQVYFLFEKLTPVQANCIALRYVWNINEKYPGNNYLHNILADLVHSLTIKHHISWEVLKERSKTAMLPDSLKPKRDPQEPVFKTAGYGMRGTQNIKTVGSKSVQTDSFNSDDNIEYINSDFHLGAFADIIQSDKLKKMFADADAAENEKKRKQNELSNLPPRKRQRLTKEFSEDIHDVEKVKLGFTKIMVFNPYIFSCEKEQTDKLMASQYETLEFNDKIMEMAKTPLMPGIILLSDRSMEQGMADKMNEYAMIKSWAEEKFNHSIDIISAESEFVYDLTKKYQTDHIFFPTVEFFPSGYYVIDYSVTNMKTEKEEFKQVMQKGFKISVAFAASLFKEDLMKIKRAPVLLPKK